MIKKIFLFLLVLILILGGYYYYVCTTTGFFREIKTDDRYVEHLQIPMYGGEDITPVNDSMFLVSADHRLATANGEPVQGQLYLLKIKGEEVIHTNLTEDFLKDFHPHGIDVYNINDSVSRVLVVNHPIDKNHYIEEFELINETLVFKQTYDDDLISSPNDVVIVDKEKFFFTNDHGSTTEFTKFIEEQTARFWSNVAYYDGDVFTTVADGISYANGINFDKERNLLFVASPRQFQVKVYTPQLDGQLEFIEDIPCGTGVDNIEFDDDGKMWIGCHPNLLQFVSYMAGKADLTPTEIITIDYKSKGQFTVDSVYENDGSVITSCSVARPFGDYVVVGTVADDHISILKKK